MNITKEGNWLQLSKVYYKDEWYQIYASSNGIRTFIKLRPTETYPTLKSLLYLDRIFNYQSNGVYYDMDTVKQLLKNYFKFTLNLNVFKLSYEVSNHFVLVKHNFVNSSIRFESATKPKTLIKTEEIKEYLDDVYEMDEIIDENDNISNKYKELIKKYVIDHQKEDLSILAYNLKHLKLYEKNEPNYFDKFNHVININPMSNIEVALSHELRHASKFTSYDDVYTILHNDFLITNYKNSLGLAVLEGINSKYSSNTYSNEQSILDIMLLFISEEELLLSENENINVLIDLLSKYNSREKIIKLIMMMDENLICRRYGLKYDINSKKMIYSILIESYFNKIDYMLDNITMRNIVYEIKKYREEAIKIEQFFNSNSEILKSIFKEMFDYWYRFYIKKCIDKLDFKTSNKLNNVEEIEGFIFIEKQIYHENYIINDENFITKRVKYNASSNDVYIYNIYIKKEYLINTPKSELLEYVSLDGLNEALIKVGANKWQD